MLDEAARQATRATFTQGDALALPFPNDSFSRVFTGHFYGHLREDGLMVHDLMLVQVKKPEDSKYPWDYYLILTRIPGEQAFGPPNPACPLVKG